MPAVDLSQQLSQTRNSVGQALADLDALAAAAAAQQQVLAQALAAAAAAAPFAGLDSAAVGAFLAKPYLVRPRGPGRYELIVPRFLGLRAGWPVAETETYSVFEVSRFLHLISPLPDWLAGELQFAAPSFRALLDGLRLLVTEGDPAVVYQQLGGRAVFARRDGPRLYLREAARLPVLRRIIREEGFLPYAPAPVPPALQRPPAVATVPGPDGTAQPAFRLRPYQAAAFTQFLDLGAVSLFAHPQTGKTFVALQALAVLRGPKLVLAPRRALIDQWQARLRLFLTEAAAAEVTVTTYQAALKHFAQEWSLVVFDEAHHLPANFALEAATALHTQTRLGLSATPFREDGNQDLIPLLCGFPIGADWPVTPAQRPAVTVWITADKPALVRELCARPAGGKTLLFVQRLEVGHQIAALLDVPFVHAGTRGPGAVLAAADTVVVSSIADEGLTIPGIRRIIEVDFLFGSRMQAGQRVGRLMHQAADAAGPGAHHVLMTPAEYLRHHKRLLVYEAWGLPLDVQVVEPAVRARLIQATAGR